jgi:O-antigen/teichoic acid export membrane protein
MASRSLSRSRAGGAVSSVVWATAQAFGARLVAQAAGFVIAVLIARALGPQDFGVYSFMLIGATLLAQVPGAGLDLSAVRISARHRLHEPERAREVLLVAGLVKAGIGLALALLAMLLASQLAGVPGNPEYVAALRIAAPAALALAMTELLLATLQAYERFGRLLGVSVLTAALKFAAVALLWALGALTLPNAMLAFLLSACAGLALSTLASWRLWAGPLHQAITALRELLAFSRWFVFATLFGALASNLDVLAVSRLAGAEATGVYAAGRTLTLPLAFAGGALGAVLLPRLSGMGDARQLGLQLRRITGLAAGATAIAVTLIAITAQPLVELIYGAQFAEGAAVLRVLALAYGLQLVTWPALTTLMVLDRPDLTTYLSLAMLGATGAGYLVAVPIWGALGAAWVFCGGTMLLLSAYLLVGWHIIRRELC